MTNTKSRRNAGTAAAILAIAIAAAGSHWQASTATAANTSEKVYKIGFHLWKPGKIYDEAMAGIRDGLKLKGIKYEEVLVQSKRDKELAEENLKKLDTMGVDLIYSLSSAGTKIANRLVLKTPVIATVINHPASLGVGKGEAQTGTRLTGTSYYVDSRKQLELYRTLFPAIRKVGMIYDANNPAGALAEEPFMRNTCKELGLAFKSKKVTERSQIKTAAEGLIKAGAGVIVIPTNKLVYGNLQDVLSVANAHKVPVVSMSKQGVENGALAGLFADTYDLGRLTANMAQRILHEGEDLASIDYKYIDEPGLIVNLSSAKALGYQFPPEVLGTASIVIE